MRKCLNCETVKDLSNFYRKQLWCKTCKLIRNKNARDYKKQYLNQIKSVPCADCKQTFHPICMDFDHIKGTKSFTISQRSEYSLSKLLEEISKCEVVCSNCHRLRTLTRSKLRM